MGDYVNKNTTMLKFNVDLLVRIVNKSLAMTF